MKTIIITSMNKEYYDRVGQAMLESYVKHQKDIMPLYIYNEDDFPIPECVKPLGFNLGSEYNEFLKRHPHVKGQRTARRVKFAKKGFSVIHAMKFIKAKRLLWLDADTIIKKPISEKFVSRLCPTETLSTHFSVWHDDEDKNTWHSCETGFFILNKKHNGFEDFKDTYSNIYYTDNNEGIRRFYDGDIYGRTVTLMESKGYNLNNLNTRKLKSPIGKSVIKDYVDHYKAKSGKVKLTNETLIGRHNL